MKHLFEKKTKDAIRITVETSLDNTGLDNYSIDDIVKMADFYDSVIVGTHSLLSIETSKYNMIRNFAKAVDYMKKNGLSPEDEILVADLAKAILETKYQKYLASGFKKVN